MGFFRKFVGFLGFGPHNETKDEDDHYNNNNNNNNSFGNRVNVEPVRAGPRKGFGVPVHVPVSVGPNLVPCNNGDGGVQKALRVAEFRLSSEANKGGSFLERKYGGLRWYTTRLRIDEDGDVADEFLYIVSPEQSSIPQDQAKPIPKLQVKYNARPAKIKQQVFTPDGKLQHRVDYKGQLQWV